MEQDPIHRHKDVLSHTVAVVAKTPDDLVVRLAALFHDIAKPRTRSFEHGGVTFRHHEVVGGRMARKRLTEMGYDERIVDDVSELVRLSGRFKGYADGWSDAAVRRYARDAGPLLGRLNALVRSDCTTRNKQKAADLQAAIDDLEHRIATLAEEDRRAAERPQIDGGRGDGPSRCRAGSGRRRRPAVAAGAQAVRGRAPRRGALPTPRRVVGGPRRLTTRLRAHHSARAGRVRQVRHPFPEVSPMVAVTAPLFASPSLDRPATVSVVIRIADSDEWDDVDRALESLWRQTVQPDHVVVVVDHDDHLLEWAADAWSTPGTAGDMRVDVVANTRNPGHAGARDTGIQWAWGEIVAFLARDAVADPHWVETLLEDYADTDVAGVGGGALADWGTMSPPAWLPPAFGWAADCAHPRLPGDRSAPGDFTAANLSFRREVLVEIGGFTAARGVDRLCRLVQERFPRARLRYDDSLEVFQRMDDGERTFAHFRRRCFARGSRRRRSSTCGFRDRPGTGPGLHRDERRGDRRRVPRRGGGTA